jgi:hypothetical protein
MDFKKITNEVQTMWNLASLLSQAVAAVVLVSQALGATNPIPRYASAVVGAVITVTVLAKLYSLIKK